MTGQWITEIPYSQCRTAMGCEKPRNLNRMTHSAGSIWQCQCGQQWIIDKWESDQREGSWPVWKRHLKSQ